MFKNLNFLDMFSVLQKLYMNINIIKAFLFWKMKYNLKGYERSHKMFWPNYNFVLIDNIYSCFVVAWGMIVKAERNVLRPSWEMSFPSRVILPAAASIILITKGQIWFYTSLISFEFYVCKLYNIPRDEEWMYP